MSGLRNIAKGGWHPSGKDGKKESGLRNDFKGINQIVSSVFPIQCTSLTWTKAGWMGKGSTGGNNASEDRGNHVSRPLTSLKDRKGEAFQSR